ncbi:MULTISPECIES: hypothetical protein [unclassified Bradyrhizobium]|uniref:preATP grasp domain-containing protein n=1 Tax=unclassified Bradyrhizobium TaxID=2631580 RepID=UPI000490D975|nr:MULTISPECIES: hypothetical protein [unclassified Bradyrhizobium]MCK7667175.1 hypothetical protein [Bradyrhizobium sp. 2S1]QIG94520.1 hypothetical protein G6P99_20150 [Bradyrhizobium sp. 6(2017)]
MNAGTAQMSGADLTAAQLSLAANSACRSAWFAQEGDLIVSPVAIPADLLSFIGATLNIDASSLSQLVPGGARKAPVLDDCTLLSEALVKRISNSIFVRNRLGESIPATSVKVLHAWRMCSVSRNREMTSLCSAVLIY